MGMKMFRRSRIFFVVIILLMISIIEVNADKEFIPEFQKGICYVVWSKDHYVSERSDESLKKLAETNAEWVGLHTTWYQEHYNSTEIYPGEKTPSDEGLIHAIETIHSLGLKVMLKPHIDLIRSAGGEWRGSIECDTEEDWQTWFDSYTSFIVHYAQLAQEHGVELFCIGTELSTTTLLYSDLWRDRVIESVWEVYDGPLTYAANWDEEYLDVQFWDALDYAGIDPYFPLVDTMDPSFKDIKKGWERWAVEIEEWQKEIDKPVIFTEVGYISSTGAAKEPWKHMPGKDIDIQQQVDCYKALFQTFYNKSWFAGVYWWMWGGSVRIGGPEHRGFSPQNKPAQDIIAKWYKKNPKKK